MIVRIAPRAETEAALDGRADPVDLRKTHIMPSRPDICFEKPYHRFAKHGLILLHPHVINSCPERSGVRRILPSGGLGRSFCCERPLRLGRRGGRLRCRDLRSLYLPDLVLPVGFLKARASWEERRVGIKSDRTCQYWG